MTDANKIWQESLDKWVRTEIGNRLGVLADKMLTRASDSEEWLKQFYDGLESLKRTLAAVKSYNFEVK